MDMSQVEPPSMSSDACAIHASADLSLDLGFSVGQCCRQGLRDKMEDRVIVSDLSSCAPFRDSGCRRALLLGVFDGHAGHEAAQVASAEKSAGKIRC